MLRFTLVCAELFFCFLTFADAQFLYPADPNPPTIQTTINCHSCSGRGCEAMQSPTSNNTQSCTGSRVGCWTLRNMEDGSYTRSCQQPATIRQGVFCNRHIENREFCYAVDAPGGGSRIRICAKCCLNRLCNSGTLQGVPHSELQTCVACDGTRHDRCNRNFPAPTTSSNDRMRVSTFHEQCLFPRADCWSERRVENGRNIYVRGCQLVQCNEGNTQEVCARRGGVTSCSACCKGRLCNRLGSDAAASVISPFLTCTMILIGLVAP